MRLEFGLTLDVFPPSRTNFLVSGRAFLQPGPGEPWPLDFSPLEQELGLAYPERILNETSPAWAQAQLPGWPPPDLARRFDASTMASWLERIGAGRDMVNLFKAAGGSRGGVVGQLMVGAQEVLLQGATSYAHIRGGNENLPARSHPHGPERAVWDYCHGHRAESAIYHRQRARRIRPTHLSSRSCHFGVAAHDSPGDPDPASSSRTERSGDRPG